MKKKFLALHVSLGLDPWMFLVFSCAGSGSLLLPVPWPGVGTLAWIRTVPLARGHRTCRDIPHTLTSAEDSIIPHGLQRQNQNPAVMEESKLHCLPTHELAMKLPDPDSQSFTAVYAQSRRITM